MKKYLFGFLTFILFISCQEKKAEVYDLDLLNGYWEIEQVVMPDGTKKEFKINETIDFFKVKNDSGFRKKVTPQLDGTYLINDVDEKIKIEQTKHGTFVHYKTNYAKWKETILVLTEEQLVLQNDQNIKYEYKKPTPFSVK
ncbi:lipocalin family protein [Flavobacterium sp.]|uniref:lipocalin family protein n=1 Tax=Flavobacterium sp. TaxID=239 RepID=UPI0026217F23|nr:lipocalin family protein [Flavobacterium sp.]MDD3004408.1 hypothetical protein [Flavobacterium sp.]